MKLKKVSMIITLCIGFGFLLMKINPNAFFCFANANETKKYNSNKAVVQDKKHDGCIFSDITLYYDGKNSHFSCDVTNIGESSKGSLFYIYVFFDSIRYSILLGDIGKVIEPGETKQISSQISQDLSNASNLYIVGEKQFQRQNESVDVLDYISEKKYPYYNSYNGIMKDVTINGIGFLDIALESGKEQSLFKYNIANYNHAPDIGEICFSFYSDKGKLVDIYDKIETEIELEYSYRREVQIEADLSEAVIVQVSYEGTKNPESIQWNNNEGIKTPQLFGGQYLLSDIYLYNLNNKGWTMEGAVENLGNTVMQKDIHLAFLNEEGTIIENHHEIIEGEFSKNQKGRVYLESSNADLDTASKIFVTISQKVEKSDFVGIVEDVESEESITTAMPTETTLPKEDNKKEPKPTQISNKLAKEVNKEKKSTLKKPQISIQSKKISNTIWVARIKIRKHKGKYIEIYYRKGKSKYKKVKLKKNKIGKKKKVFKIGYKPSKKKIYFRVRTYKIKSKKKIFSAYSNVVCAKNRKRN